MHRVSRFASVFLTTCALAILAACSAGGSSSTDRKRDGGVGGADSGNDEDDADGSAGNQDKRDASDGGVTDIIIIPQDISPPDGPGETDNPATCEEAAHNRSYIGCDYWPTVTSNPDIDDLFDFAVVVSNTGENEATVQVTGNGVNLSHIVPPGTLETIYLPWVQKLKSVENGTVHVPSGAFHLVSSHPVTVYQFNALEYKGAGGPPGKNWNSCIVENFPDGCFSYTNDASLLLPSTALTGTYRIAGPSGWEFSEEFVSVTTGAFVAITATANDTTVQFRTACQTIGGDGIPALAPNELTSFVMQAGDVVHISGAAAESADPSGGLISADKPVQVITGHPCRFMPSNEWACDHLEESIFPAETLGKNYLVTIPAQPRGNGEKTKGLIVRIVGNFDGTTLHFDPPISAPGVTAGTAAINAGKVLDLGIVKQDFRVWSEEHSFIVATFMLAANLVEPEYQSQEAKGDPSQSFATAIEQYRNEYVFLAPNDYDANFVNITGRQDANVKINGSPINPSAFVAIGDTGLGVTRYKLPPTGVHHLTSEHPVGIQVYGYGSYTSYQYPGGLNLKAIAPPPVIIK